MSAFWEVARSFFFEEGPRSRSHLVVMRGLANASTPPPKGRGGNPLGWKKWVACRLPRQMSAPDTQLFRESGLLLAPEREMRRCGGV